MATLGVRDIMKIWTQSDQTSERKMQKFLASGLDKYVQAQSDILSKIGKGESLSNPLYRWMEEWGYPTGVTAQLGTVTMTFTGSLFGATVTTDTLNQVIRVGTILERPSDGVQAKVTSVAGIADGSPFTATVEAYGNTSLSDDTGPIVWEIIAEVWSDFKDADNPRSLDRIFREVGTQIHAETFEIPKTRKNTKYEIIVNEFEHQIEALIDKLRRQIAYAVLRSRPFYANGAYQYGNKTEEPTMLGLTVWPSILQAELSVPSVHVNAGGVEPTKTQLNGIIRGLELDCHADYNRGKWHLIMHPTLHKYINRWNTGIIRTTRGDKGAGETITEFDSDLGKTFPIVPDRYLRPGVINLVDFSQAKYGYYANDELDRKEIPTQGRYQRWLISFQTYGVVLRNARKSIATIYGLPTS